jgi:hypothetical protein
VCRFQWMESDCTPKPSFATVGSEQVQTWKPKNIRFLWLEGGECTSTSYPMSKEQLVWRRRYKW